MDMRPTLYTPEILEAAREYLVGYQDAGDPIPSIAGLACVLGVTRETCRAWGNDPTKPEFSVILMELMQRQERELLKGGLGGAFNAPITKMMLSKHGYSDRVENDHTSSDGSMTPREIIIRAADDTGNA
jgi:hypothetical protein